MPPALIDTLLLRAFGWTPQQLATVSEAERRSLLTGLRAVERYEARQYVARASREIIFEPAAVRPRVLADAVAEELTRRIRGSGA